MSGWTLWTWVSVAVLVVGSVAVFAWFLRDARRLFRDVGVAGEERGGAPTDHRAEG